MFEKKKKKSDLSNGGKQKHSKSNRVVGFLTSHNISQILLLYTDEYWL